MSMIARNNDESYVKYYKRVIQAVKEKRINYSEMGDCLLGEDNVYSSDNLRKAFYVLQIMAERFDDDYKLTDKELISEIESKKEELFKETVRLRDKNREIRKKLFSMARYENLERVMVNELAIHPTPYVVKKIDYKPQADLTASLTVSDIHYGIEINNCVNKYNTQICCNRLDILANKTIKYCVLHKVNTLNIELLGDLISGFINIGNRVEQEEDIVSQIISISNILSSFINYLSEKIPTVNVYCVFGNHARVNPNKKDNVNRENYERLVYRYLELQCDKKVTMFNAKKEDFYSYTINYNGKERLIVLTHGDKDNMSNIVLDYINLLDVKPDEIHCGHFHSFKCYDDNGTDITVNGSIVGTDNYAVSIRKNTLPSQVLRIYSDDICTYKITL